MQSPAVIVQQAEFRVITDPIWGPPAHYPPTGIPLVLRFTNRGQSTLRFNLFDTQTVFLTTKDGKVLPTEHSRYYTGGGQPYSPPVAPGQSFELSCAASLYRQEDGSLRLTGDDGFGGLWSIAGIRAGNYRLTVHYRNAESKVIYKLPNKESRQADAYKYPAWTGEVQTVPCHVRIQ